MKNIISNIILILTISFSYSQVGIGTDTPVASSSLDVTSSNSGVLFPQYDLISLTNTASPVNNPTNGLMIYNKGGASTFNKGYYYWNNNKWNQLLVYNQVNEIFNISVTSGNPTYLPLIPLNSTNNAVTNFQVVTNTMTGASLSGDTSTFTLPAGKYAISYGVDAVGGPGATAGNLITDIYGGFGLCSIRVYIINASTSATLTSVINDNNLTANPFFMTYNGRLLLNLSATTSLKLKFEYDPSSNWKQPLDIRSTFVLNVYKLKES